MKLKEIFWFTGLWLYPFLEIPIQIVGHLSNELFGLTIPQPILLLIPIPAIIKLTRDNIRRKKNGHTDFGFKDAIGANVVDEEHSMAKHKASYPTVPESMMSDQPTGLVLGKYGKRYVYYNLGKDGVNIFTIGTPGSGKSVLIQNILRTNSFSENPFNWALIDIKGEHYQKLLGVKEFKVTGTDIIHVIQPSNRNSYGWDVFYAVHKPNVTDTEILKAVSDISDALVCKGGDNPYFEANGKKIMSGLLFFYIKEGIDFIPAIQLILRTSFGDLLKSVVEQSEQKGYNIVLDKLKGFVGRDDNESIQDVEATMKTYLDIFSYPDVVFSLYNNTHRTSPAVLSDGITCLDLAIEESMLETYKTLFRLVTIQILKYCESNFKESDCRRTAIIIDEAARCGRITDIENSLATLRSRHTTVSMFYQDIEQYVDIYGKQKAAVLLNLCEIKIFLSGSGDKETSDYVSHMAGEYEIENISYSRGGFLNSPKDPKYSRGKRPVVNSKDLMSLRDKGELIAFIFGKYYRIKKLMYFNDPYLNDEAYSSRRCP